MINLNKAKEIAKNAIEQLDSVTYDMIIDDGYDTIDEKQNKNFAKAVCVINNVETTLARIDIDGYDNEELNKAWRDAWDNCKTPHLPECRMNHAIKYAQWILSL